MPTPLTHKSLPRSSVNAPTTAKYYGSTSPSPSITVKSYGSTMATRTPCNPVCSRGPQNSCSTSIHVWQRTATAVRSTRSTSSSSRYHPPLLPWSNRKPPGIPILLILYLVLPTKRFDSRFLCLFYNHLSHLHTHISIERFHKLHFVTVHVLYLIFCRHTCVKVSLCLEFFSLIIIDPVPKTSSISE
jgi:hypothetical protein